MTDWWNLWIFNTPLLPYMKKPQFFRESQIFFLKRVGRERRLLIQTWHGKQKLCPVFRQVLREISEKVCSHNSLVLCHLLMSFTYKNDLQMGLFLFWFLSFYVVSISLIKWRFTLFLGQVGLDGFLNPYTSWCLPFRYRQISIATIFQEKNVNLQLFLINWITQSKPRVFLKEMENHESQWRQTQNHITSKKAATQSHLKIDLNCRWVLTALFHLCHFSQKPQNALYKAATSTLYLSATRKRSCRKHSKGNGKNSALFDYSVFNNTWLKFARRFYSVFEQGRLVHKSKENIQGFPGFGQY